MCGWGFVNWGFTHQQTEAAVRVEQAAAIARANASIQTRPVQLAPTPSVGEVRWQTPIRRNAMAVPIQDKVELLLALNAAALDAGADYINSTLFLVNEQKYFASSDGSFIDQDIHRIWLHRHRHRQGQRQIPHPRRPVLADGHGL